MTADSSTELQGAVGVHTGHGIKLASGEVVGVAGAVVVEPFESMGSHHCALSIADHELNDKRAGAGLRYGGPNFVIAEGAEHAWPASSESDEANSTRPTDALHLNPCSNAALPKTRHITEHRQPAKGPRFAWSRQPNGDAGATTWWLFRRPSTTRRVLPRSITVSHAWSRARIAAALRAARKELLDHADAIDLRNLGVTP